MTTTSIGRDAVMMAVSDATGGTARRAIEAAMAQYADVPVEIRQRGQIRSVDQVEAVVDEAQACGAAIAHTFVVDELRRHMYDAARRRGVHAVDLMGPLLVHMQDVLHRPPDGRPGTLEDESTERAAAMNFTVKHDDGQRAHELSQADVVLIGPSRTSKTPLSVYLSYYGWRVANVPLLLHSAPPSHLFEVERERVIGLTGTWEDMLARRQARVARLGIALPEYTDPATIRQELALTLDLCRRHSWRVVGVSGRSIEEAAVEIIDLLGPHKRREP